jgi:serine O-acetyltransferase
MSTLCTRDLIRSDIAAFGDAMREDGCRGRYSRLASLRLMWLYPGLRAAILFRLSHALRERGWPGVPLLLSHINMALHGIDIPPSNTIGPGLYIPHPVGTVVHAERLGAGVTLVSGVTIGRRNERRFPTIGDRVYIGAGARVLGSITIGDNAAIGANAVVVKNVPAGAVATGVPARVRLHGARSSDLDVAG